MSLDNLDAALSGGGAKSAFTKDTPIGTSVTGVIEDVSVQQITDYMTGKLKFWDGERPQNQIVIILQTQLREDGEDDGKRGIYIKTWGIWKEKLLEAVKAAGGQKVSDVLTPGATFTDTFASTKPSAQGSDTKVHEYKIVPAKAGGVDQAMDDGGTVNTSTGEVTTPPVAAPPQASAPAAAPAPAAKADDPVDTAKQLIQIGLSDEEVIGATNLAPAVVAALRNQAAA